MKKLIAPVTLLAVCAPAALATSAGLKASPSHVQQGSSTRLFGTTGNGCHRGSQVTIYSKAFRGSTTHRFAGVPAVFAKVGSNHKFSTHVTIQSSTSPRKYSVGARCGGGTFGHATLTVTSVGFY